MELTQNRLLTATGPLDSSVAADPHSARPRQFVRRPGPFTTIAIADVPAPPLSSVELRASTVATRNPSPPVYVAALHRPGGVRPPTSMRRNVELVCHLAPRLTSPTYSTTWPQHSLLRQRSHEGRAGPSCLVLRRTPWWGNECAAAAAWALSARVQTQDPATPWAVTVSVSTTLPERQPCPESHPPRHSRTSVPPLWTAGHNLKSNS